MTSENKVYGFDALGKLSWNRDWTKPENKVINKYMASQNCDALEMLSGLLALEKGEERRGEERRGEERRGRGEERRGEERRGEERRGEERRGEERRGEERERRGERRGEERRGEERRGEENLVQFLKIT
ncbi:hypothetical protein DUI87_07441 [Hirundo rustica rustica]|uniref:Uncharacterized protein n=1 Tax=Hirundo rustica rustica TaxID=333673 RepID=A0A3M0KQ73_HIRRU|nr:hypothetical protein DUI87_07441 [Hirundo rustica rustica]